MQRLLLLLVVAVLLPCSGYAQSSEEEPPAESAPEESEPDPFDEFREFNEEERSGEEVTTGKPLETMSRAELRESGFEFGNESASKDTSAALLLSTTVGTAIHGIGHLYLGDRRTGFFLLGMEATSLALIMSSSVFYGLTEGASPWSSLFAPGLQLGIAGFFFSYAVDVIGSLQGEDAKLAENTTSELGIGFRARYGFFNATGLPLRHAVDVRLATDAGGVYGALATTQDVFLDLASYRANVGVRPLRGRERLTFLAVESNGEVLTWQGDGEFGRISADGRVNLSYQLGRGFPRLSEFAFGLQGGLGNYWYQIAPRGTATFALATSRLWVPFDFWGSMNVSSKLNARLGYGSPDLSLVPGSHRLLGVAHIEFTYRSSSYGDISLRAEIGDGFALWLGGGLWFGR